TLKIDERPHALALPIEAVPAGSKSVLIVDAAHRVAERPVTLGLETPTRYEVLAGLQEGDMVMIGNPGQLPVGEKVEPRLTAPLAREYPGSSLMSRFALRFPSSIIVLCLITCVVGVTSLARMPVDLFPPIRIPVVVVATFFSGMPPEQIETDITGRFERFF